MYDSRPLRELIACQKSGWSLEQRFYTDPEIYQLELDQIVMRTWLFAGHQSQLPEPGDYKVFEVDDESVILIRGDDNSIKAFANVCRHRGSVVCLESSGNKRRFECPYHGWVYGTDGKLLAARNMPEGFEKDEHGLHRIALEIFNGLIFVCFSDDPPSMENAHRDLDGPMAMFGMDDLQVAAVKTYPIKANWKLAVENYHECYHCASAHQEYARMHTLMLDPKKQARMQSKMLERMPACGLKHIEFDCADTEAASGQIGYTYSRTAMFEGYQTGSRDGSPVAPLLGELTGYDGGASDIQFGPVSFFLAYSDHVLAYVFTPVDLENCACTVYWMVRGDAVPGKDFVVDDLMWLWDVTTYADEKIIVNNYEGIKSRYYQPGPFAGMEVYERRFIEWLLHELRRAPRVIG